MSKKKIIVKTFLTAFCILAGALLARAESCSTAGQVQYKYTAGQPDDCSYTTQTRTCCSNKQWSAWGGKCSSCNKSANTCDSWQIYAGFDEANCKCECPQGAIEVNGVCECDEDNGYYLDTSAHRCVYEGSGGGQDSGIWVCDHGSIISYDGCSNENPLRGYSCQPVGASATAYEDIGAGQCEMASCVCE